MTPLVLLLLLAFLMVIAASLMIWAALTVGDARARAMRAGTNEAAAPRSALTEPRSATSAGRSSAGRSAAGRAPASAAVRTNEAPIPSSSGGNAERERRDERAAAPRADERVTPARPDAPEVPLRPSNDDVRGARAVVTPRTRSDDAFERFLEGETKDRGFPPIRPDERRES